MTIAQGRRPATRLSKALRTMRANYVANIREGKCKDDGALAELDAQLENIHVRSKGVPSKR